MKESVFTCMNDSTQTVNINNPYFVKLSDGYYINLSSIAFTDHDDNTLTVTFNNTYKLSFDGKERLKLIEALDKLCQ